MKRFINLLILQILTFVSFSQTRTTSGDAIRKEVTPKYLNGVIKQLTIAQLKTQSISNGDSTTLYYVTDTGKKGYFELDKNDNSSVGNDSTIIVTNNGKRLKRTIEQYLAPSTTGKYYRGDKTWQTLDKSVVGLSNVDNTSDLNKPISTTTQTALLGKLDKGYSISELRGLSNSVLAATQIFYCNEAEKEGFWKYDASDNSSADNLGTILVTSGGKRLKRVFANYIYPEWFGAKGDGVNDDTNAINATFSFVDNNAITFSISNEINNSITYKIKFGQRKNYRYNGSGYSYNSGNINIEGAGVESTRIKIENDVFLIQKSNGLGDLSISGIKFSGGKGVFNHSKSDPNVSGTYRIENCSFYDYSTCAIGFNSSDMPYIRIINNIFFGKSTSIGVAMPKDAAMSVIENNKFLKNKFHIKANDGGRGIVIEKNDFIRFDNSFESIDIWLVPSSTSLSGNYGRIIKNKFGNENLRVQDPRILIADENLSSGGDFSTRNIYSNNESTGILQCLNIYDNIFYGIDGYQNTIYSYSKKIRDCYFSNIFAGTYPVYFFYVMPSVLVSDDGDSYTYRNNMFVLQNISEGSSNRQLSVCNKSSMFIVSDINQYIQNQSGVQNQYGASNSNGVNFLLPIGTKANTIQAYPNGTDYKTPLSDSNGGNDAFRMTSTEIYGGCNIVFSSQAIVGKPMWIEFDVKKSDSLTLDDIRIKINRNSDNVMVFSKFLNLQSDWRRVRYMFVPREAIIYKFEIQTPSFVPMQKTKFDFGRLVVYQSNEPFAAKSATYSAVNYIENDLLPIDKTGYSSIYVQDNILRFKNSSIVYNISPTFGTVQLINGSYTVTNSNIKSTSGVKLTVQDVGVNNGTIRVSSKSNGQFTISSSNTMDNCTVYWEVTN